MKYQTFLEIPDKVSRHFGIIATAIHVRRLPEEEEEKEIGGIPGLGVNR